MIKEYQVPFSITAFVLLMMGLYCGLNHEHGIGILLLLFGLYLNIKLDK